MYPLKYSCKQQKKKKKKVAQQSQRAAEVSVILKLCFGSCKILILCMQLRDSLHSGRSCYFVLGKTILEGLFRINKKIEVNKAFFMISSYPQRCKAKDFATVPQKCT